jgi:hypothetical protein
MKNIFLFSAILFSSFAFGQKAISVTEAEEQINNSKYNSLSVMVYSGNVDDVKKAWKKQLKEMKGKVSDKKVLFADDCELKAMGDNSFDVYSRLEEVSTEGVRLIVAVDLGGAYLSSVAHGDKFKAMRDVIYNFGVAQNKAVVGVEIEAQNKVLSGLEKELADLEKQNQKLDKDLADYKEKIKNGEADKVTNANNRAAKAAAIAAQKTVTKAVQDRQAAIK